MAIFEWEDNLSVGVEKIDVQHQELIQKLNQLAESILQKEGKNKIAMVLKFMGDYGKMHFSTEEELMAKYGFPELKAHKNQHDRFNDTTNKLLKDLDSEKDMEFFASQVQRFLIDWLILHIKTTDKKFGDFLKGK
jgi:hemerythrin-like metal-binding protein